MAALAIFIFAGFAGFHRSQAAPCDPFQLLPIFASYPEDASGGSLSGSFGVWLGAGCTWLAATDASWIHITGGSSGTGNGPVISGIVTYDVDSNTGGQARSAKIYVRAENTTAQYLEHTVFQDGWQYQPVAQILMPVINPTFGQGGTIIRVTGSGFGTDPDALAAGVLINPSTIVPLKTIQGGLPDLHLGVISQDIGAGGLISVTRGQGRTGFFKPAFADIVLRVPAWIWTGNVESVSGVSAQPFTLRPTTPPAGTHWFFSGAPSNGALGVYLSGNWSPSNRVSIDLFAENPGLPLHRAARLHGVEFPGGTLLDCARRICDALRCAFSQMGMVAVNCEVELTGAAVAPVVKITLSFPEGPITRGGLIVGVEPASPPPTPEITGFSPTAGGEGTPIAIAGRHFGSNPRNLSAAILNGASSIPLRVISASETQAVAVVGPVPPRVLGGPIQLTLGDGNAALVGFQHGDIRQPVVVGTLYQTGPNATSRDTFTPQPGPEPPVWPKCFFSDPPSGGQVCLTISGAWPTPAKVSISAGLHDTRAGKGRDIQVDNVEFQSGAIVPGNPPIIDPLNILECAYRICDVIGSGSLQGGGFLVNCSVQLVSPGVAQICLSMVDGFVDQGHLNVCVQPADYVSMPTSPIDWGCFNLCIAPPAPPVPPVITDIQPRFGASGEIVHITGRGFGNNPDNLSIVVLNGAETIPLRALRATDTMIVARLGLVSPGAQAGPIRISKGVGVLVNLGSAVAPALQPTAGDASWIWHNSLNPSVLAGLQFQPFFNPCCEPNSLLFCKGFYSGPPVNGDLCVFIDDGGAFINLATIELHAFSQFANVTRDLEIPKYCWGPASSGASAIAQQFCNAIVGAFQQQGIVVNCWVQPAPDNKVKLVFSLPEGIITEGHIRICLRDGEVGCIQTEPVRPRLIQSSNPNELLLTWPRSLTGYQLEATDDLFGSPPGHVNWVPITLPLRATDTELQMTLPNGPGQPQLFFRLSKP